MVAVGAHYGWWIAPVLLILATCTIIILVAWDKVAEKYHQVYLYAISMGFVLSTTMLGKY
ncbi:hypothetical protein LCGC14_0721120, partial [marine sediment metagenome]